MENLPTSLTFISRPTRLSENPHVKKVKKPARVALLVAIPTYNDANVLGRIVGLLLLSTERALPELMAWYWQTGIGKINVELFFLIIIGTKI